MTVNNAQLFVAMEEKLAKFREQLLAQQSSHVATDSGSSLPEEPVTDIVKEEVINTVFNLHILSKIQFASWI